MKKIGIITLFGYCNYGNRLQMFASQSVFKALGFSSEIIRTREELYKEPLVIQLKIWIKNMLAPVKNTQIALLKRNRIHIFKRHSKAHYIESNDYVDPRLISSNFHESFSFFSVGSDQIWGWFNYEISQFVFLEFAPEEKRIAFSPSFGSSELEAEYQQIFAQGIKGFRNVSVREASGAKIVEELTGKEATVLCDPTMCLTRDEWLDFSSEHKRKPRKKYVLTYFLGSRPQKVNDVLERFSDEFTVVHLNSFTAPEYYAVNPSEWVDYVNGAALFLTDSFHGVAFAILMQTPFSVYERVDGKIMHTRISHILEKFELEERYEMAADHMGFLKIDFSSTEKKIIMERENALGFLEKSLGIKGE